MSIDLNYKISKTLFVPNRIDEWVEIDTNNEFIYDNFTSHRSLNRYVRNDGANIEEIIKSKCNVKVEDLCTEDYTWETYIWDLSSFLALHQNSNSVFRYIKNDILSKLNELNYSKEQTEKLFIFFTFY